MFSRTFSIALEAMARAIGLISRPGGCFLVFQCQLQFPYTALPLDVYRWESLPPILAQNLQLDFFHKGTTCGSPLLDRLGDCVKAEILKVLVRVSGKLDWPILIADFVELFESYLSVRTFKSETVIIKRHYYDRVGSST